MTMIDFVEKEPWYFPDILTGNCRMTPIYMVKDGVEHFMFNQSDTQPSYQKAEDQERMNELRGNAGAFFTFYGGNLGGPVGTLKYACREDRTLSPDSRVERDKERNYLSFHGNFREVSAAFHFRIYDIALGELVESASALIQKRRKREALALINQYEKERGE